jgi:hypothetical protein
MMATNKKGIVISVFICNWVYLIIKGIFFCFLMLSFSLFAESKSTRSEYIIGPMNDDYAKFLNLQAQKVQAPLLQPLSISLVLLILIMPSI